MNTTKVLVAMIFSIVAFVSPIADTIRLYPTKDAWCGTVYNTTTVGNTPSIRIGGWGDQYIGLWQFNLGIIPSGSRISSAYLYFYPDQNLNQGLNLVTSATLLLMSSSWNENGTSISSLRGYQQGSVPLYSTTGTAISFKAYVEWWMLNPNNGIALLPEQNQNNYYHFPSRESSGNKPRIVIGYSPNFKMPLPGGKSWRLTVQAGGVSYDGIPDPNHFSDRFYSLDFSPTSKSSSGVVLNESNVAIYAMAGGYVYEAGYSASDKGNYVKIDHDNDNNINTGFQSVYLHMRDTPLVRRGNIVSQGRKLGIMGDTGDSEGTHIHITLYYKGTALVNGTTGIGGVDTELNNVTIEGRLIKDYKLGSPLSNPVYYPSSNTR